MARPASAPWSARTARSKNCIWRGRWCAGWAATTSTTGCATPSLRSPRAYAGSADRLRRCRCCSGCWSSARTCAKTTRCSRSASARRHAMVARSARWARRRAIGRCRWRRSSRSQPASGRRRWPPLRQRLHGTRALRRRKGPWPPTRRPWPLRARCWTRPSTRPCCGNAAAHRAQASRLLALANWIGEHTGATVGYLTEAANTVGAQWVGAYPLHGGLHAGQMLAGGLQAALLLNTEPVYDSAAGAQAATALAAASMVVSLSPFQANMQFCDVLLPIAPFTETSGSFANAEGRLQSFHAVVRPLGETRAAWKVLRVLANLLGLDDVAFENSQQVLARATDAPAGSLTQVPAQRLSNAVNAVHAMDAAGAEPPARAGEPAGANIHQPHPPLRRARALALPGGGGGGGGGVASIYQLDAVVRRARSLQLTADARMAADAGVTA